MPDSPKTPRRSARPRLTPVAPRTSTRNASGIRYRLHLADPAAHLFDIELTVSEPAADGQRFTLPAWIPGSYLIREFARHVTGFEARAAGRRLDVEKIDKHTWQVAATQGPLHVRYRVYGWDLSVRGAHFDSTHAFFNGTSVFLRVEGQADRPCAVELVTPDDPVLSQWRVATTLPRDGAKAWRFGDYRAASYDELIDHPVEIGSFALARFDAGGVPHHVAITGHHDADLKRLCADLQPVCEAQVRLFEPRNRKAPFDGYLFLVTAVGDGYGGLEHRASTALICKRSDLPYAGQTGVTEGYRSFLGLASHEYFHSWNVKRIKPARFAPYDLERENYTRLLWIFEGFTSYYDDLMLRRAGAIDTSGYLQALGTTIANVLRTPGRHQQSVAESSFEAWSKYYRQDENSPNAIVSYYTKGALVALCLDLTLRQRSQGRRSLDDVMRRLWQRYGRDFHHDGIGLAEDAFAGELLAATGIDLSREIRQWAYGTTELPLAELLAAVGIALKLHGGPMPVSLGARTAVRQGDVVLATVHQHGPAHAAGLSAGDQLVALDGLKASESQLKDILTRSSPGRRIVVHAFRRDELLRVELTLAAAPIQEVKLEATPRPATRVKALQRGWLGAAHRNR